MSSRLLVLIGLLILGALLAGGWLFRDAIDPPPETAPLHGPPPKVEQPTFRMPEAPRAPGQ